MRECIIQVIKSDDKFISSNRTAVTKSLNKVVWGKLWGTFQLKFEVS